MHISIYTVFRVLLDDPFELTFYYFLHIMGFEGPFECNFVLLKF
jgi:hypothetical protein